MIKKILSHSVIYALGPQLPKLVGLILLPVLTPHLSGTDFGVWGTISAYALVFSTARDMGMVVPLFNSFYKHINHWKWVWRQVLGYLVFWGVGLTFLQFILLYLVFPVEALSSKSRILTLLSIQIGILELPILIGSRYLQVGERPWSISIISIVSGSLAVFLQYYLISVDKLGYMGWFYATFASMFIAALMYSYILYKEKLYPILRIRWRWARPRMALALPLLPHSYSSYLLKHFGSGYA